MTMGDWQRANMDPDDPGSQGYNAEPIRHPSGEATSSSMEVVEHDWYECPRCSEEMDLVTSPNGFDSGPDRVLTCPSCKYAYAD